MLDRYISFALAYRAWHNRTTPIGMEHKDACSALSGFETFNLFCLSMLLPIRVIPVWLFVGAPLMFFFLIHRYNRSVFAAHPIEATYARLTDNVPAYGEFPAVYCYLAFTLVLFVACLTYAIRSAA